MTLMASSNEQQRKLGIELRRARTLAGLSGRDLASKIQLSQSKISRIESGSVPPTLSEVRAWADAVQMPDELRSVVLALTEAAHTSIQRWTSELRTRRRTQRQIEQTERAARRIATFQPSVVPGLLQTAEYSRRIFEMLHEPPHDLDQLAAVVAARVERQQSLYDVGRQFDFLVTEAALRWRPGTTSLLAAQLDRVSTLSTLSNVEIGVLPLNATSDVPYTHAFTMYELPGDEIGELVDVEVIHGSLQLFDDEDIDAYRRRWSKLRRVAVYGHGARALLHHLIDELHAPD
jgi:transcriptional regulator with XRE-family HTH domain